MSGTFISEERRRDYAENAELVAAAHELRLSLDPPHQSLFRVVCILLYEDVSGRSLRITGECLFPCLGVVSACVCVAPITFD